MRKSQALVVILIVLCLVYFLLGWIAVFMGWISKESYFASAGIVGAFASVLGLFSLSRPAPHINMRDLEIDALNRAAQALSEAENLKERRDATEREIKDLQIKKDEMEILVRKASMSLFLKDQRQQREKIIMKHVEANEALDESLQEIADLDKKIQTLDVEIESDPNVDLLRQVIQAADQRRLSADDIIDTTAPPPLKAIFLMARLISDSMTRLLRL